MAQSCLKHLINKSEFYYSNKLTKSMALRLLLLPKEAVDPQSREDLLLFILHLIAFFLFLCELMQA